MDNLEKEVNYLIDLSKSKISANYYKQALEQKDWETREITNLWLLVYLYQTTKKEEYREQFIEKAKPVVLRIACSFPKQYIDECCSYGLTALLEVIEKYDRLICKNINHYITFIVRNRINDELRNVSIHPRAHLKKQKRINDLVKEKRNQVMRKLSEEEIDEIKNQVSDKHYNYNTVSLETIVPGDSTFETDKDAEVSDFIEDKRGSQKEKERAFFQHLKGLSQRERLMMIMYYLLDYNMKEIGNHINMSESRVSQLHAAILARMKRRLVVEEKIMS